MKKILMLLVAVIISASSLKADTWAAYRVGIDPGHGGSDPGALGPAAPSESVLALRVSLALKSELQKLSCGVKLTRESDVDVSLSARVNWSVSYDPYVFNSIHLNAFNGSANGCETWYYWTSGNSYSLAAKVQAALVERFNTQAKYGVYNRGVKNNAWTVITGSSNVPAILTEGLFVDNYTEWNLINDNSKAGFQAWKNGHLFGWYDLLATYNNKITNPRGGVTPDPTIEVTNSSSFGDITVGQSRSTTINVKGSNLKGNINISSNNGAFTVSPTSLGTGGGNITVTFKPTAAQSYSGTITLTSSGATTKTIAVSGKGIKPKISLTEKWQLSEQAGNQTSKGWDATKVRNFCYNGGRLFLVYNHADIKVVNAQTGADLGNLNLTGVEGGTLKLCDVQSADGKIVACNLALTDNSEKLRVYVWDNVNGTPRLLLETANFGGATRCGDCISIYGNLTNGEIIFGNDDRTTCRILSYKITNGTASTTPTVINATTDGTTRLACATSVRVKKDGSGYWINGKDCALSRLDNTGKREFYVDSDVKWGNGFAAFNYDDVQYGIINTFNTRDDDANHNYLGGRMLLLDASDGWAKATTIGEYPSKGMSSTTRNTNCTGGVIANAASSYVETWVLSTGQGIAYCTYGTVPQHNPEPINPGEDVKVSSITVTALSSTINVDATTTVSASVLPANATNKNVTWSSDNPSVASISGTTVTGVAAGVATITATAQDGSGVTGSTTITVKNAEPQPTTYSFEEVWTTTDVPAKADARQATVANGKLYIQDKANKQITIYDHSGKTTTVITDTGAGTNITSDDAGNIIVRSKYGFPGVLKSDETLKVYPGGNPTNPVEIALDQSDALNRQDFFGRVRGDILSGEAIMPVVVNESANIALWGFNNGAYDADRSGIVEGKNVGTNIAVVSAIIGGKNLYLSQQTRGAAIRLGVLDFDNITNEYSFDDSQVLVTPDRSNSTGTDGIILGNNPYIVYNIGSGYYDGFAIAKISTDASNQIIFKHAETTTTSTSGYQTNWVLFDKVNSTSAYVYHYFPGGYITCYLLKVPGSSVDTINEDVTSAVKAVAVAGGIEIRGEASSVSVYSITGKAFALNAKTSFVTVPAGIYVVNVDGKTTKVIVK